MDRVTTRLSDAQHRALQLLGPVLPDDAYLAGGVGLALYLGHRVSHDLDVFVGESDPLLLEERLITLGARIESRAVGTLYATLCDGSRKYSSIRTAHARSAHDTL